MLESVSSLTRRHGNVLPCAASIPGIHVIRVGKLRLAMSQVIVRLNRKKSGEHGACPCCGTIAVAHCVSLTNLGHRYR